MQQRLPVARFTDASLLYFQVRMIKSKAEVGVLRRCAEITQAGAQAFVDSIQEGRSELEILVAVESALKRNGSDEVSFTTQAAVAVAERRGLKDCLYSSPNVKAGFMGHAIGTHYHEPPWIDLLENTELRENMVLVLEPILRKKGVGGVLIEDAVLVTAEGGERLSNLDIRPWRSILS